MRRVHALQGRGFLVYSEMFFGRKPSAIVSTFLGITPDKALCIDRSRSSICSLTTPQALLSCLRCTAYKAEKLPILRAVSVKLNLLRVFFRLAKDGKVIDLKKYMALEETVDEIGRMLCGWMRSAKES